MPFVNWFEPESGVAAPLTLMLIVLAIAESPSPASTETFFIQGNICHHILDRRAVPLAVDGQYPPQHRDDNKNADRLTPWNLPRAIRNQKCHE